MRWTWETDLGAGSSPLIRRIHLPYKLLIIITNRKKNSTHKYIQIMKCRDERNKKKMTKWKSKLNHKVIQNIEPLTKKKRNWKIRTKL